MENRNKENFNQTLWNKQQKKYDLRNGYVLLLQNERKEKKTEREMFCLWGKP